MSQSYPNNQPPPPSDPNPSSSHHSYLPLKRPFPDDSEDDDDLFANLSEFDPDTVGDNDQLSGAMVRKMLKRMQKLEGTVKKMRQERNEELPQPPQPPPPPQSDDRDFAMEDAYPLPLHLDELLAVAQANIHGGESIEELTRPFNVPLGADSYNAIASSSDDRTLESAAYTYNVHTDDGIPIGAGVLRLPSPPPPPMSEAQMKKMMAALDPAPPAAPTGLLRKKRGRGKSKARLRAEGLLPAEEEVRGGSEGGDEAGNSQYPGKKKIKTPELNRAVLKRMWQVLDIRSATQLLPLPYDPESGIPNPNVILSNQAESYDISANHYQPTLSSYPDDFRGTHNNPYDPQPHAASSSASHDHLAYSEGQYHDPSAGPAENAAAAVLHMVMAAQQQNGGAGLGGMRDAEEVEERSRGRDEGSDHRRYESGEEGGGGSGEEMEKAKLRQPFKRKRVMKQPTPPPLEPALDEEILAWRGFVPDWTNRHLEKNAQWFEAIAASVLRIPPLPTGKGKPIPWNHLQDPEAAISAAKTSFGNLCEKYKKQTDPEAEAKGERHKRLTRRKGRRAEKLMRRNRARDSEEFMDSQWRRDRPELDISPAFDIDAMSSEYSNDEDDPTWFQLESERQLPDVDRTKTILEVRTPDWQSEELGSLWETLDEMYPKILRKTNPDHFFAPAHPRFKRAPRRDPEPKKRPGAGWMVDRGWLERRNGALGREKAKELWYYSG